MNEPSWFPFVVSAVVLAISVCSVVVARRSRADAVRAAQQAARLRSKLDAEEQTQRTLVTQPWMRAAVSAACPNCGDAGLSTGYVMHLVTRRPSYQVKTFGGSNVVTVEGGSRAEMTAVLFVPCGCLWDSSGDTDLLCDIDAVTGRSTFRYAAAEACEAMMRTRMVPSVEGTAEA